MKIAITRFPYHSQLGGEELHTLQIAEHWRQQGHDVIFIGSCQVLSKLMAEHEFKVINFDLGKPPVTKLELIKFTATYPYKIYKTWLLNKLLKLNKVDFIYMLSFTEKLLLPWFLAEKNFIFMEHARIGSWFSRNPWHRLYYFFAQKSRCKIVTVSQLMANRFREIGDCSNLEVIVNGIDVDFFAEGAEHGGSEPILITTIGRLTNDKGILDFINFLQRLTKLGDTNWRAVIVGEGPLNDFVIKKIENLPIKLKSGLSRKEIAELLRATDLFCLLSTEVDPFGLVVAEAMAAGCATIATNVCGITNYSDLIETVKPKDLDQLVDKYYQMSIGQRIRFTEEARAKFSQEQMLQAYDNLLSL